MKRIAQSLVCVLLVMVTMFTVAIEESHAATLGSVRIECIQPEDDNGDEVYLSNDGDEKIWPTDAPYIEMNRGSVKNIEELKEFTGTYTVKLYEYDSPDPNDLLGDFTVNENEPESEEVYLTGLSWNYKVNYQVSQ